MAGSLSEKRGRGRARKSKGGAYLMISMSYAIYLYFSQSICQIGHTYNTCRINEMYNHINRLHAFCLIRSIM